MKTTALIVCAAMVGMTAAAQTVDVTSGASVKGAAKQEKVQKAAALKEFKAKQKEQLAQFIALQNNPELADKPIEIVKPQLTNEADSVAYLFGSFQANGLKQYLQTQLKVDTTLYMNDFYNGLIERTNTDPEDKKAHAYQAGIQIGNRIADMATSISNDFYAGTTDKTISPAIIANAIIASLTGQNEYKITEAQQLFSDAMAARKEINAKQQSKAGTEWLADNAKKQGVVTLPSGLQYKVLTMGNGPKPTAAQKVTVNYEGRLIDGTVFDSSYRRGQPSTFGLRDVIRGWTEALQLMPVGSKWEVYIPYDLAYGDRDTGTIPPYSTLIFTIELIEIEE